MIHCYVSLNNLCLKTKVSFFVEVYTQFAKKFLYFCMSVNSRVFIICVHFKVAIGCVVAMYINLIFLPNQMSVE